MRRDKTLAVNKSIFVSSVEPSSDEILKVFEGVGIQRRMVDWRRKTVQIWHKHVDLVLSCVFFLHLHHWHERTEIITERWLFVGAHASENCFFRHSIIITEYACTVILSAMIETIAV